MHDVTCSECVPFRGFLGVLLQRRFATRALRRVDVLISLRSNLVFLCVSMLFCVELLGLTCRHCLGSLMRIRSRTSATQLMMNCSPKSQLPPTTPPTTFYMHFCHHHLPHHRTTVLDSMYTHFSYLNAQHISLTVISSYACCTRTSTRPSYHF